MIPHILHHIWLGPRHLPAEWASEWARLHPGWKQRIWREKDLAKLPMVNRAAYDAFIERSCWHGASDVARISVLAKHGGVYVDIDSKPLRTLEGAPFMSAEFFAGYEPVASLPGRIANGTIGSVPGHPILETYDQLIAGMKDLSEPWDTTGGTGLTAAVLAHRRCCQPAILPPRTFYPVDARGRPVQGSEPSYVSHMWATTNNLYPPRTVILVPRRAGDPRRDALWEYVKRHWEATGWPIYVGHHDAGPFNAAAARNEAARNADCDEPWEVAVFVDADTIMLDHEPVREGVITAARTGKMVRPYDRYLMTEEHEADALMTTGLRPEGGRIMRTGTHGGVNIVPRSLFEAVGGYDERFKGWGSEDTAFEISCRVLGGFTRLKGEVIHLWHPISADRNTSDPGFIANVALRHQYEKARTRTAMLRLIAERDPAHEPRFGLVIITNGRREWIGRTIASLEKHVGPFDARLICDDSGKRHNAAWLSEQFGTFTIDAHRHLGHGRAVRHAFREAARLPVDWVFFCEDDMEFTAPVDLRAMARVMDANRSIAQMVVKRQAWFPAEVAAGPSVIDRFDPALFTEHTDGNGSAWLEHREFYSLNPHLVRRSFLRDISWPPRPNSEHHFTLRLFRRNRHLVAGMWGKREDPPLVEHIGLERTGTGY